MSNAMAQVEKMILADHFQFISDVAGDHLLTQDGGWLPIECIHEAVTETGDLRNVLVAFSDDGASKAALVRAVAEGLNGAHVYPISGRTVLRLLGVENPDA